MALHIETLATRVLKTCLGGTAAKWLGFGEQDQPTIKGIVNQAVAVAGDTRTAIKTAFTEALGDDIGKKATEFLLKFAGAGPIRPENVSTRFNEVVAFQMATGFLAHCLAAGLSVDVLACLDINATGLAAFVADFAGFNHFTGNVLAPFYRAYLGTPWGQYLNSQMRPTLPGLQDLLRLRSKRIIGGSLPSGQAPSEWMKYMSYLGYSDKWIEDYHEDLWTEPSVRELQIMADVEDPLEDWLKEKVQSLGFDDRDRDMMTAGLKRRMASAYIKGFVSTLVDEWEFGLLDLHGFSSALDEAELSPHVRGWVVKMASEQVALKDFKEAVDDLRLMFTRDQITATEYRTRLGALGMRADRAERIVDIESIKRYHAVPWLTEQEEMKRVIGLYQEAFVAGLETEGAYAAKLSVAGLDGPAIRLRVDLDKRARDRQLAAWLRTYELPALREMAILGDLSPAAYRARLVGLKLPEPYLAAETAYMTVLKERNRRQRVERYQIPPAEACFTLGLIGEPTLTRLYGEAGLVPDEWNLRLQELRSKQAKEKAEQQKKAKGGSPPTKAEIAAAAEIKYVNGLIDEADLRSVYADLVYPPDHAEKRITVLKPLREAALAAAE